MTMPAASPDLYSEDIPLVRRLMNFFRERRFEAGERLPPERYLAAKMGVGRNALREAIATLSALRVLEIRANSGIYLKDISAESSFEAIVFFAELGNSPSAREVIDMMEVRLTLESDAVTRACARRTDEDLAALQDILRRTDEALADQRNIVDLDQEFHMTLAAASHNAVLARILHPFYRLSLPRRQIYFADIEAGKESAAQHRKLVKAIADRKPELARKLIDMHMGDAKRYWSEILAVGPADAETPAG